MKGFLLLLLFCLTALGASAQSPALPALDANSLELARRVFLPVFGFYLLCSFVLAAIKVVLNYLLKRQIVTAAVSESIVERLLPGAQDEQNKVVKWVALLLSSGAGLWLCTRYLPLGLHSLVILLFSTGLGLLAYYLFLRCQAK
ncbi:hypothetical protein [Hymenobacter cellulosilyticus]|uniref:DUF2178 domain-containing protein n=1 Tax=Hymenobacter cellulosilyticus TaxID=2932248 RepID=A0A8T9Q1J7_9BACT|nr:hypothetical protein [Hymenobacter cellulosilyticus]UOQ70895.1 hypothetical protein MUN79_19730 [Hymenobacter cellulosilyticus]